MPLPTKIVYFMARGSRRRVPDMQTLTGLAQRRLGACTRSQPADLIAIPEGPPLPTRREGTLYQGTDGVVRIRDPVRT